MLHVMACPCTGAAPLLISCKGRGPQKLDPVTRVDTHRMLLVSELHPTSQSISLQQDQPTPAELSQGDSADLERAYKFDFMQIHLDP